MSVKDLLAKGDGRLVKTNGVWTYPGAPIDPSGTNLKLPVEHVSHAEVMEALGKGDVVIVTADTDGSPLAITVAGEEGRVVLTAAQVGTAEAGTELPPNSRPSIDAGKAAPAAPTEGSEKPGKDARAGGKEPTSETDPRKGR